MSFWRIESNLNGPESAPGPAGLGSYLFFETATRNKAHWKFARVCSHLHVDGAS